MFWKTALDKYGFSDEVVNTVRPIVEAVEKNSVSEAEKKLAQLALEVCDDIEKGTLTPIQGDGYFTLVDLFLTDNFPKLELRQEVQDIIFEGMILHDYGKDYGADLSTIRFLANKLLHH